MKILYFIYCYSHASGGHFHSLDQVSRELSKNNDVGIISMGPVTSPVIDANPRLLKHIPLNTKVKSLFNLNKELNQIIKRFQPELLHCFDTHTLNRLMILPTTFSLPIILNKCGGPHPNGSNYYHADGLVVFSTEDYDWFIKNNNYRNELIYNIPNRVQKLEFLPEDKRTETKDPDKITFLRVSRLGGAYEKTLSDNLRMIESLKNDYPVQLILVGKIQDHNRFRQIQEEVKNRNLPVKFITDKRASKGSDFLYLADFVIGTGRSFMEALSLGIPMLTPAKNNDWPVVVNKNNFQFFSATNFSERNIADKESLDLNESRIRKLTTDKDTYKKAQSESKELFDKYLSTRHIQNKYTQVYYDVLEVRINRFSILRKNLLYLIKYYLNF